jgi:oligoribonuclease NrnB/cAMP/cGMP phosphodiesterase (DHH superfamily)
MVIPQIEQISLPIKIMGGALIGVTVGLGLLLLLKKKKTKVINVSENITDSPATIKVEPRLPVLPDVNMQTIQPIQTQQMYQQPIQQPIFTQEEYEYMQLMKDEIKEKTKRKKLEREYDETLKKIEDLSVRATQLGKELGLDKVEKKVVTKKKKIEVEVEKEDEVIDFDM